MYIVKYVWEKHIGDTELVDQNAESLWKWVYVI